MQNAEEADDLQAIGVRCREVLITLVDELKINELTNDLNKQIKKADVKEQLGTLYDYLAAGNSMRKIRSHVKASAESTWELVG